MVEEFDALKRWYPSKYSFPSRGLAYARVVPPKYCILQKLRRSLETCPMFIVPITDRLDGTCCVSKVESIFISSQLKLSRYSVIFVLCILPTPLATYSYYCILFVVQKS